MLILHEPSFPRLLIGHNYSIYYTGLLWAFIQMRKYKWKFVASIDALGQYHCYSGDYCLPYRYLNLRTVATNVVEYFLSWLLRNGLICIPSFLGRRTTWPLSLLGEGMERESAPSAALGRVCPGIAADGVGGEADGARPEYMPGEWGVLCSGKEVRDLCLCLSVSLFVLHQNDLNASFHGVVDWWIALYWVLTSNHQAFPSARSSARCSVRD